VRIKQASKTNWLAGIFISSSIPVVLIVKGIIIALIWTIHPDPATGITDTTVENTVFFGGLYLALPCGLLSVVVGIYARSKGLLKKGFVTTGIIIGILGILIGLLAWSWYIMVSSFTF
jgi:hypothetical protein